MRHQYPKRPKHALRRTAFTLLELLLSLALIVVATGLIGFIMQMYAKNFGEKADDIRRKQLGRAILTMIAEDIRSVVMEQEFDESVLEAQLGAQSSGGSGGASTGSTGGSGLASDSGSDMSSADGSADGSTNGSASQDPTSQDSSTMMTSDLPPGIYGDQFSLIVDVSRLPRQDEYLVQQTSLLEGTLTDVPGDIKRVQYFVQTQSNSGVADDMAAFGSAPGDKAASVGMASGLVRRSLDRGVLGYAEEVGDIDRIQRTGDLVAPEVIALQFAFYDGINGQWVYEWDSSQQSLPWLVQISLAMQSRSGANQAAIPAGTPIASLTLQDQRSMGVEVYELVVAIPGANLVSADAASADAAAGMDSMGL